MKLDSKMISHDLKIHLRQPYGWGTLCMTCVKPYAHLTNFRKKLTTDMNSSKPKM